MLHLISYEFMRHNCQVYGVCRFIVFVWGPYINDWDSETNCFTIIQLYYMLLWRLLNFTNQNHKVIRVWMNINTINLMFQSLYYAVYNMNNRISTPKYWNIFSFLQIEKIKKSLKTFFLDDFFLLFFIKRINIIFFCFASLSMHTYSILMTTHSWPRYRANNFLQLSWRKHPHLLDIHDYTQLTSVQS